ncbi:MAG: Sapep family Mn(2+)-dependent dipeptidase [Eggerthellaceae bacterium]|nr:Sapep family Mn(2+)-dependent dipeptidase [Eggerthellaceae bacterium]
MAQATSQDIETFIDEQWASFLDDAARLVEIDSSLDAEHATDGAPFGPGARRALDETLAIAARMGLAVHDGDGYAGYADLPGESGQQLGVIGHVDVVPAGEGWHFPPFSLTRKDGMLIGRGTADDKVPVLCALYALKFWIDRGVSLRHDVRFIFGCNEESGMAEIPYYLARHDAPDFLFTPDAEFPLCYGEKGLFGCMLSREVAPGAVVSFEGGIQPNAVPSSARAVVRCSADCLPAADRITLEPADEGCMCVRATGVGGHASLPDGTVNAVGVLAQYLLDAEVCSGDEQAWLTLLARLAASTDGSFPGVAAHDADFGALTSVVGVARKDDARWICTVDVRFPASTCGEALVRAFMRLAQQEGCDLEVVRNQEPFLVDPNAAPVQALMRAYRAATNREVLPFTMGGATYAREFPRAVSFGPAEEGVFERPSWVGGMHAADEGVPEAELRQAMAIYIRAFGLLAEVDDLRS